MRSAHPSLFRASGTQVPAGRVHLHASSRCRLCCGPRPRADFARRRRAGARAFSGQPGPSGGTTRAPACKSAPSRSAVPHHSMTFPSRKRRKWNASNLSVRPVAGTPARLPPWVPSYRTRPAIMSPSAITSSTVARRSGSDVRAALNHCFNPSGPLACSGIGLVHELWRKKIVQHRLVTASDRRHQAPVDPRGSRRASGVTRHRLSVHPAGNSRGRAASISRSGTEFCAPLGHTCSRAGRPR